MKVGDYEINPYATIGGGLAGAALGYGAYKLDTQKTKKKLATYIALGSALGLGTTALATLENYRTPEQKAEDAKRAAAEDIEMNAINMGARTTPTVVGGLGGYLASRGVRSLNAKRLSKDDIQDIEDDIKNLVKSHPTAAMPDRAARKLERSRKRYTERASGILGMGKGSKLRRTGRLLTDLGISLVSAGAANLINNITDKY